MCEVRDKAGRVCQTTITIEQAPVTIPFVGFSEALDRAYVYVQNTSDHRLAAGLLEVAGIEVGSDYHSVNSELGPQDKGCLIYEMSKPFSLGDYVHVGVWARWDGQEFRTLWVVRAANKFPLMFTDGTSDAYIGLDSEIFFVNSATAMRKSACVQTMLCPAHGHGSDQEAVVKFLENRNSLFARNERLLTQMWICRADRPRAWYKFGALPDVAVMNPILGLSYRDKAEVEGHRRFSPFVWLGSHARSATGPNRYLACIDLQPSAELFLRRTYSIEEFKCLVYCAVASGAKGILYRGKAPVDRFGRESFVRLNAELRQLKHLLMIAEPVDWSSSANSGYWTRSLLCADAAILVMVFDGRYFSEEMHGKIRTPGFCRSVKLAQVEVRVPPKFSVVGIEKFYGTIPRRRWSYEAGRLEFECRMVDSVQVYKVVLNREYPGSGEVY
jgi:hypothetical protein